MPYVVTQLAVRSLSLELGHRRLEQGRVLHHVRCGTRYTCKLVEACQFSSGVRSGTFATDLRVLAVGVGFVHVRHTTFLTQFARHMVNRVQINNLCHFVKV